MSSPPSSSPTGETCLIANPWGAAGRPVAQRTPTAPTLRATPGHRPRGVGPLRAPARSGTTRLSGRPLGNRFPERRPPFHKGRRGPGGPLFACHDIGDHRHAATAIAAAAAAPPPPDLAVAGAVCKAIPARR